MVKASLLFSFDGFGGGGGYVELFFGFSLAALRRVAIN